MTCARTVSGVGAAAQTAESIALSSQVGSASWAMTAEMGAIEAKVFLFAAFAPHPLHTCKGSVRFGGGAGGRDRRRGTCSSPKRQQSCVREAADRRRGSRAGCAATGTAQWAVPPSEPLLEHVPLRRPAAGQFRKLLEIPRVHIGDLLLGEGVDLDAERLQLHASHVVVNGGGHVVDLVLKLGGVLVAGTRRRAPGWRSSCP